MTADLDGLSVVLAAGAAVLFALANNLQRTAASVVPLDAGGTLYLIWRLLRSRRWLGGSGIAVLGLGLHTVALARGGVILVQAVLSAGLIVALAFESLLEGRRMPRHEVLGSLVLVAGVVGLLSFGRPSAGGSLDLAVQLRIAGLLGVVVLVGCVFVGANARLTLSAVMLGLAGGVCFALDAVFLRGVAVAADDLDAAPALTAIAGLVVSAAIGNVFVQRAYQRAPLRVVLPAVAAADPLAAFGVGRWVLGEHLQADAAAVAAIGLALVAIVAGILLCTAGGVVPADDAVTAPRE